jgi:hypothetical protein
VHTKLPGVFQQSAVPTLQLLVPLEHSSISTHPTHSVKFSYPELQVQVKLPIVFVHAVFSLQYFVPKNLPFVGSHSSMSLQNGWATFLLQYRPGAQSSSFQQPIWLLPHMLYLSLQTL